MANFNLSPIADDEMWEDIPDYGGNYRISNYGRVMSLKRKKAKILSSDNEWGYPRVNLSQDGKTAMSSVDRLVAFAFIPNPENLSHINHIDNNPRNNHVSNLEWRTHHSRLTSSQVATILTNEAGLTQAEMARKYDISERSISRIVRGSYYKKAYVTLIPTFAEDKLDPCQFRVYSHILRNMDNKLEYGYDPETIAARCQMTIGQVRKAADYLVDNEYIEIDSAKYGFRHTVVRVNQEDGL